jgi:hypothetical protein
MHRTEKRKEKKKKKKRNVIIILIYEMVCVNCKERVILSPLKGKRIAFSAFLGLERVGFW